MNGTGRDAAALAALITTLKTASRPVVVDVRADDGARIGGLQPITADLAGERCLHEALSAWRAKSMQAFLTVYNSTPERTADFLARVSVPDTSRLLCLIRDAEDRPAGNIGLCNIRPGSAELDNVLRGTHGQPPGFMQHAARAFLQWACRTLALDEVYLHVLEDNAAAIRLYAALGFRSAELRPLWRRSTAEGYALLQAPGPDTEAWPTRLLRMTVSDSRILAGPG